ncbi:MAG TPA: ABC transporter substrate-binding protein [Stellaceae bacterium]|nr:ABC transporter substrate-binding protein [Stellaceae bacterium]
MRRSTMTIAALALVALPLAPARAEDFKIGAILSLTGPGADIGKYLVEGAKAAVAMVNAKGGIGGMHVEMTVCDTQTVEQQAVLCARRLLFDQKVDLLLGAGTTPQTQAILPTVAQAGVPTFAIAGATVNFRPLKKWVFKALATNEDQIPAALAFLKGKGMKTIADIRDNGPFGADVAANLKTAADAAGMQIVDEELYTQTDTDMTAQVTHVRASNPDVIWDFSSNPPPGAIIAKKVAQLGMKQPIVGGVNLQTKAFAELAGEGSNQFLYVGYKAAAAGVSGSEPLAANLKAFRAEFDKIDPGAEVVGLSVTCADSILLTQVAAKSLGAKALDHEALLHALETIKDVPGIQGFWTFTPTSHESSLESGIAMLKYVKGEWVAAK